MNYIFSIIYRTVGNMLLRKSTLLHIQKVENDVVITNDSMLKTLNSFQQHVASNILIIFYLWKNLKQ